MTTLTIQLPAAETEAISAIADILKKVQGSQITIDSDDDDGFSENEFLSLQKSLEEASLIQQGKLKPLSMNDLWNE